MPSPTKKPPQSKCSGCGKYISAAVAVACASCPATYHKGCAVGITDAPCKGWACLECKRKVRRGDNSSTPVGAASGSVITEVTESQGPSPAPPAGVGDELASSTAVNAAAAADGVRELRRELAEYVAEMREFRREMAEHRVLIAGVAARMDGVEQRLELLEAREAAPFVPSADVAELERTVVQLQLELGDRDQEALLADLEIGQLHEEKGESPVHVVTVLAAQLGVTIEERDIVFAERVGAAPAPLGRAAGDGTMGERARDRRLVVRLARRSLRDELLRAARVRRSLTAADVGRSAAGGAGAAAPRGRIFVNERLTRANRQLFYRVREECRKNQWRFSWTKRGRIFVRQADGTPAQQIRSDADIARVLCSRNVPIVNK